MAKMKQLNQYPRFRCPTLGDFTRTELTEAGIDPDSIYGTFVRHEIDEDRNTVTYIYACDFCGVEHEDEMPLEQDFLYIGECPAEEDPFPEYSTLQTCTALIAQLRETFGPEPEGAVLRAKYEAGTDGRTVVCKYDTRFPLSMAYAFMLEGNLPEKWSKKAIQVLEEITRRTFVRKENWVRFWFDCNVWFNYVHNRDEWNNLKETLKRNNYEASPLSARSCKTTGNCMKFGFYSEYTEAYTLRDFFHDNGMKP